LQWLDLGDAFQTTRGANEWKAFVEVCKSQLAFNPQADGVLAGASKLANARGALAFGLGTLQRGAEALPQYPEPNPPMQTADSACLSHAEEKLGGWPQWNEEQEKSLQQRSAGSSNHLPAHEARKRVVNLRRTMRLVASWCGRSWASHRWRWRSSTLALVAEVSKTRLAAGSVKDLQARVCQSGLARRRCRAGCAGLCRQADPTLTP
jgi:hypothetical protein